VGPDKYLETSIFLDKVKERFEKIHGK